jgi:tripartite-type tricarboxylate transporter receptor subunit TctC
MKGKLEIVGVAVALMAWGIAYSQKVEAQNYPTKPVRLIIGFTPGTTVDILGRLLAQRLGETWGHRLVVENMPGASSTIAAAAVARAPADGYTMMFASTAFIVSQSLYKKLPYDGERDFEPITLVAMVPNVLVVHPTLPVRDIRGLIALARSRPGELNYAHSGLGSASHLNTELFKVMAKVDILPIPYKSSAQALTDVMSGEVLLNYPSLAAVLPHVQARRVKPLAVSGAKRSQALPDVPAMAEFLPGYEASGWYGVVVPAKTPDTIVAKLNQDIVRVLNFPDVKEKMTLQGAEVVGSSAAEFRHYMREGRERWANLIQQLNVPRQ